MDESAIESLLYDRLTYSASLSNRFLSIFVRDMTPEEYMDALGFSEEEKDWASLLYSTLTEDQNLAYEDSDGDGYYNTDYGNITYFRRGDPGGLLQSDGRPLGKQDVRKKRNHWGGWVRPHRTGHRRCHPD